MGWRFWQKKSTGEERTKAKLERLSRPKEIPEVVGRYLIVHLKKDPDWAWGLKAVVRQRPEEKSYDVRVFDRGQTALRNVDIKDYTSLDGHPDLILYEGWFEKATGKVQIEEKNVPAPRAA